MNSYSVSVCICFDLLVHCIQLLKVSIFLCWKKRTLESQTLFLCATTGKERWCLIVLSPQKYNLLQFMTDNLTKIYIYKLYIKSVSETFLGIFFYLCKHLKRKTHLKHWHFFILCLIFIYQITLLLYRDSQHSSNWYVLLFENLFRKLNWSFQFKAVHIEEHIHRAADKNSGTSDSQKQFTRFQSVHLRITNLWLWGTTQCF